MDSLTKEIEYTIKSAIEEFIQLIDQRYDEVDLKEVQNIWNNVSNSMKISVSFKKQPQQVKNITVHQKNKKETISGCPYVFTKGTKKGECCGSKPKTEKIYCSKHTKFEGTDPKKIEELPESREKPTIRPTQTNNKIEPKPIQRVLRKHKDIGKLWHPESDLVFKSAKERVVIGKCVENELVSLKKSDLDTCKQWGFKIDEENCIDDEKVEHPNEEEEEKFYLTKKSSSGTKKFWECTVKDCEYITRFGKEGKEGTFKTKKFDNKQLAIIEMNKSISLKKKRGYIDENVIVESSDNNSGIDLSELENTINSIKNSSSNDDNEISKQFIKKALGLSKKLDIKKDNEGDEEDYQDYQEDEEDYHDLFVPH